MTKNTFLKIANPVIFTVMVTINILANVLLFGGYNTAQLSAMYPTLLTPPGWTFIIWSAIYVLLAIFLIRQYSHNSHGEYRRIGFLFIISCLLNTLWIIEWHSQHVVFAAIVIIGLMLVLLRIYTLTREMDFLTRTTFGIYYAWITMATVISLFVAVKTLTGNAPVTPIEPRSMVMSRGPGSVIADLGMFTDVILISGNPEIVSYVTVFEYAMSVVTVLIITAVIILHFYIYRDYSYVITIMWALGGMAVKQATSPTPPTLLLIVLAASVSIIFYFIFKSEYEFKHRKKVRYEYYR